MAPAGTCSTATVSWLCYCTLLILSWTRQRYGFQLLNVSCRLKIVALFLRRKHTVKSPQNGMHPLRCCELSARLYRRQFKQPLTPESRAGQDERKSTLHPHNERFHSVDIRNQTGKPSPTSGFSQEMTPLQLIFKMLSVHTLQNLLLLLGPKKATDRSLGTYKESQQSDSFPVSLRPSMHPP